MSLNTKKTVDAQGLICPEPIMMLHGAIRDVNPDEIVKVIATDPSTVRDINQFCEFLGHDLLDFHKDEATYIYWIKKVVKE